MLYYAAGVTARPANTGHSPKVGSMLAQRLRRWSNIEPTLDECFVFAGVEVDPTRLPISAHFDADHPSYPRLSPNV